MYTLIALLVIVGAVVAIILLAGSGRQREPTENEGSILDGEEKSL